MYHGRDGQDYADLEESILACLLIKPEYMENLIVEERHFKKFDYVLTFMKEFYDEHKCFDITLMFSLVKGSSLQTLLDTITYLLDIFVVPTNCMKYQKQLLLSYKRGKKEEWVRKKIYEKTISMCVGKLSIDKFNREVNRIYDQAEKIEWR